MQLYSSNVRRCLLRSVCDRELDVDDLQRDEDAYDTDYFICARNPGKDNKSFLVNYGGFLRFWHPTILHRDGGDVH